MLKEAVYYAKMTRGLFDMLRGRRYENPKSTLCDQLEHRGRRFLEQVHEHVFSVANHPYREMFRQAGCEYGDLENAILAHGLEPALHQLRDCGVYLSHDEIKGKTPIVRNGREIPGTPDSFIKRGAAGHWTSYSGGSRSAGTATPHSQEYRAYRDCYDHLLAEEFNLAGCDCAMVLPILPSSYAFTRARSMQQCGAPMSRWFAVGNLRDAGHYRLVTRALVAEARLLGAAVPWPDYLPDNDFSPVVRHIERSRDAGPKCVIWSVVSPAVRVATAAMEQGVSLKGVLFIVGGEALTEAKREVIEQSGAEALATYFASEIGTIGYGCRNMRGNCVHLFEDALGVIAWDREAPLTSARVQSLHFTTLLASNPRMLINAEFDDHGILGPAACDCAFSKLGFRRQIDGIWSFSKLTGYGATLVGSDILRVLEVDLPRRFGGQPGDYQMVETDAGGLEKLILRVSPRVGVKDCGAVREFFLSSVGNVFGGSLGVRNWRHGDALSVLIEEPEPTRSGKVLALHLLATGTAGHERSGKAAG